MTADSGNHEHECAEVLAEVYLLLDKECTQQHEAQLRQHLEDCPPCFEEYGISDQIKQLLARKCGGDHAPDELKERLLATIRTTVIERGGTGEYATEVRQERYTAEVREEHFTEERVTEVRRQQR